MRIPKRLLLLLMLLAGQAAWASSALFYVSADTSSLAFGTPGYLQFELASGASQSVTATVQGFNSDGTLDTSPAALLESSDVSGNLPGDITLTNATYQFDYYSPGFSYGTFIQFNVLLNWSAPVDQPTAFEFWLYDNEATPQPLLTQNNSLDGSVLDLNIPVGGGPITTSNYSVLNPSSTAQILTVSTTAPVPEPGTIGLLVAGLGLMALSLRRRNR